MDEVTVEDTAESYTEKWKHAMKNRFNRIALAALAAVTSASFIACGSSTGGEDSPAPDDVDETQEVSISVGDYPSADQEAKRQAFDERVAQFQDMYPHVTVTGEEVAWNPQTFSAQVAAGTLPTTIRIAYTEIQGLIANGQVADVTDFLADSGGLDELNPAILANAQDSDGRTFGIPVEAYSMALFYNRDLYEQAGLDPDQPPVSWEELRANSQAIADATGQAGFVIPSTQNHGGWVFSAMSYGFGGLLQERDGDDVTSTIDNPATAEALDFLHALRWEDDSFGQNFLMSYDDISQAFAAGQIGHFVGMTSSSFFNSLVTSQGMPVEDIGLVTLPQTADGLGTLGGGAIAMISPNATPNEIAATLKWIQFFNYDQFFDPEVARATAKADGEAGNVVGAPALPLVAQETYDAYLESIEDYINVPRENYASFLENVQKVPVVAEPSVEAQQIYALLDVTVQQVLTDQNADIDALLADVQAQAAGLVASR